MKKEQLAINSISTRGDFEEMLAAYRAAGFRKVEFALSQVKDYLGKGHTAAGLRALLDRYELQCIGGFETTIECFSDNVQANHDLHVENAKLLAALGGTNMVVGTDGPKGGQGIDALDGLAKGIRGVADRIAGYGVNILIEFNWSPVVKSLRTASEIVRRSGASNAGVLFDPAHYHCTPTKFDQLTPENVATIKHVHVNDMRDKPGELSNCNDDRELPGRRHPRSCAQSSGASRNLDTKAIFPSKCSSRPSGRSRRPRPPGKCTKACFHSAINDITTPFPTIL